MADKILIRTICRDLWTVVFAARSLSITRVNMKWGGQKLAPRSEKKNRSPNTDNSHDATSWSRQGLSRLPSVDKTNMKSQIPVDFKDIPPSMRKKFRLFQDETEEVLDSADAEWVVMEAPEEIDLNEFEGLSLERGKTGVYDIQELVQVLNMESAVDVCVVSIPAEIHFADFMVVASGRSSRQLIGMAAFISRYYKAKKHELDPFVVNSISKWKNNWVCMDLGNIILHLMDSETRRTYDIEALWALGPDHDPKYQSPVNTTLELIDRHSRIVTQGDQAPRDAIAGNVPARLPDVPSLSAKSVYSSLSESQ